MADDTTQETEGTESAQTASREPSGQGRTFTQEEVNRMVGEARQKERRKYEGYVDGESAKDAAERAEKAEAELARLRAEAQRAADTAKAAKDAGVPLEVVQMLNGESAEDLAEQAKRILKLMPVHPTRTDDGGTGRTVAKKSNADRFADAFGGLL